MDTEHHPTTPAPGDRSPYAALDDRPLTGDAPRTPDDRWWSDVDRRHRALLIAAVVVGVVLLAVAVGVAVAMIGARSGDGGDRAVEVTGTIPAAEPATAPPALPASETTGPALAPTSTPATRAPAGARAPMVAFRRDGAIWVADERGRDERRITGSAAGPFTLSPDGRTLAVIDTGSQTLSLVAVADGRTVVVGRAVPDRPSFSPDSAWLVYTSQPAGSHDTEVDRVAVDGSGRRTVGPGYGGRVAPDGSVVAISVKRTQAGTPIDIFDAGAQRSISKGVSPNALAPLGDRIVFADAGGLVVQGRPRPPSLEVIRTDGGGLRELVASPAGGDGVYFGDVMASPDGRWVAYTESGDDGYSRVFVVSPDGGRAMPLPSRRDTYLVGWSADGTEVLYVEGNGFAEEATRLMAIKPDGADRRTVVENAGL